MFKYGGPIKEGIMHGMTEPRQNYNKAGKVLKYLPGGQNIVSKISTGTKDIIPRTWSKLKNIFGSTSQVQPITQVSKTPVTKWSGPYKGTIPGGTGYQASGPIQKVWTPKGWVARDPLYRVGSAAWAGKGVLGKPLKWAGKQIATPTGGIGLTLVGTKWLWPDGEEASQIEIEEHLNTGGGKAGGVPGGGDKGMTYTDPSKAEALAKEARKARLDKYLDTMGYDKANKRALGDALVDASAIVQGDVDEAGSLKKADWGRMINKAIQATSKRLDKPEQIREAVGLMMTKADIEKDMNAEKNALDKLAKTLQIKGYEKQLAGETLQESINAAYQRTGKFPTGSTLAGVARTKGIEVTKVIPTKEIPDDMSAIDYISIVTEKAKRDGDPMPKGHYVIKDRLVEIDESGDIIKQLI